MIRDAILACGIVMSYASQILVPGLPLGFGETFLALWIAVTLIKILGGGRLAVTPALNLLVGFWLVFTLALAIGTFVGYFTAVLHLAVVLHDAEAMALVAVVTCLLVAEPGANERLHRVCWWVVVLANVGLAYQVALGFGWLPRAGIDPWFWDRFRGWSANPNQIALYCAMFGPLAIHLATTSRGAAPRILGLCGAILPFYVGRLTKSDTFLYTTILYYLIFLGLRTWTWVSTGRATLRRQLLLVSMITVIPLSLAMLPYALTEVDSIENFAKSLTKDKGGEATIETAELRLALWSEALEKGAKSASLGLGPGPHLDAPPVVSLRYEPRPFEAHNTILDVYTQGGLIAVLALLFIFGAAALAAWLCRLDAMLALIACIVVFSFPHLIIRHPIVWFALSICLAAGAHRMAPAITRRQGALVCAE